MRPEAIRMGLWPSASGTRLLAMDAESKTILRGRLSSRPSDASAVTTLLQALAIWEGRLVSAVLVADASSTSCPTTLYRDTFAIFGDCSELYELAWVTPPHARVRDVETTASFAALERLLRTVMR